MVFQIGVSTELFVTSEFSLSVLSHAARLRREEMLQNETVKVVQHGFQKESQRNRSDCSLL